MASALETLCGQAVGAEQFEMLGIYMQRSWVITSVTALVVTPFFVFTAPLLKLLHQSSCSVRVSNELGAGRPRAAKFSVAIAVVTSISIGIVFTILILAFKGDFPKLFSGKTEVVREASKLGYFLTGTVFLNSIQPVLYGVAVGAGWQLSVALVNAASYYVFGLPLGALLGYKFKLRAQGIWTGILAGCLLQTIVLMVTVLRTNFYAFVQVVQAEERVRSHAITASPENENGATEMIAAQRLTRSDDEVPKSSSISNL